MYKELVLLKDGNWSLNLEDAYYEEHQDEIMTESIDAIRQTRPGFHVNLVTPEQHGNPTDWLISPLQNQLQSLNIEFRDMQFVDQCGCGGYVLRVHR